jgi:integrase
MPKRAIELGALQVARLRAPGAHPVGGVPGLHLQISPNVARSWILNVTINGERRYMGLGGFDDVSLADARRVAREKRALIAEGIDPLAQAKAAKSAIRAAVAKMVNFKDASSKYIESHRAGWRNVKHAQQWENTLATYADPVIGAMLVADIELPHIIKILEPIWRTKTETAHRVRGRIESVLDWATVQKLRTGENPARWKGNLDQLLASPEKVTKTKHHRALDVDAVSGFTSALRLQEGMGARALEFAILTAARSGEVRGATWGEIDIDGKVWIVPAERMKAGKEHRVPLSAPALKLLGQLPRVADVPYVFAAPRGGMLSDMTLSAVMRRMKVDAVPHGFRSTFRDWVAERTAYPGEMAEMALAHTIGDKVEAAYRRGDQFDKRRNLMDDWARFIDMQPTTSEVIPIGRKKA